MKIKASTGENDLATVYIAELDDGRVIEFVESVQPPLPREKKWVLIVSTLAGCPVRCRLCDAGEFYRGKLSREDILAQIDYLVDRRYPNRKIPADKFKIQFARMGDPAFNRNVLDVLRELPFRYRAPGLMPSLSTIAPAGTNRFFTELLAIKKECYDKSFQLQFSIHTTDTDTRDWLIPTNKWDFAATADYGERFYTAGGKKISLNFAIGKGLPLEVEILQKYFNPDTFLIKITPVNPTYTAQRHNLCPEILPSRDSCPAIGQLERAGYEVIISIGELEENRIGSNCGQHVTHYLHHGAHLKQSYTYPLSTG